MRLSHLLALALTLCVPWATACSSSVQDEAAAGAGGGTGSGKTTTVAATTTVTTGAGGMTGTGGTGGETTVTTTSSTTSGPFMEGPFPSPPQVSNPFGGLGPVLTSPQLYAIFYSSDDAADMATLTAFVTTLGASDYWKGTTAEYGVGPATAHIITITDPPPASPVADSAVQTWLEGEFGTAAGTAAGFPATPGDNDLYILFYPSGTNVTLPEGGGQSVETCVDEGGGAIGGYHDETMNMGVPYAVVPRCNFPGGTLVQTATSSGSHEIIEGVTDPHPNSNPAYLYPDVGDIYWALALGGGELGDMCAQNPQAFTTFPGFPYQVQRIWSNKAAKAGHDPCQPEPAGEVYYNAAPVMGMVDVNLQGQTIPMHGVTIPVGQSKTIPVEYYSEAPFAAWPAQGYDYNQAFGGPGTKALLTLELTPPTGDNDTMGSLKITVDAAGQAFAQFGGNGDSEVFFIASSNDNGQTVNWWFGLVTN
jgi:hypothetical protein